MLNSLRASHTLLSELERLYPPTSNTHHAILLDGEKLRLQVSLNKEFISLILDPEEIDLDVGELLKIITHFLSHNYNFEIGVDHGSSFT